MSNSHIEIGKSKIPITGYDLLGYLIPGSLLIMLIYIFEYIIKLNYGNPTVKTPIINMVESVFSYKGNGFLPNAILFSSLCIIFYIIGHIIASAASFLADHCLVAKGHGYPYELLLKLKPLDNQDRKVSQGFYLGSFFWVNAYIAIKFISFSQGVSNLFFIPRIIAIYVFLAFLAKIVYHQRIFMPEIIKNSRVGKFIAYVLQKVYPGPYLMLLNLFIKAFSASMQFNDDFIGEYKQKFSQRFNMDYHKAGSNNFWLSYIYVIENCPDSAPLITNWLHLYAFARNISMGFYLALLYILIDFKIQRVSFLSKPSPEPHYLALLFLGCAALFLMRYIYLYFSYFSKFTFRAFCAHHSNDGSSESG